MYSIYKITSPSGRYYIGLTKQPVLERWRQHKQKAVRTEYNHPFYNAIRKYGPESFTVETVDHAGSKVEAQQKERAWIANSPPDQLYNVSPGGEADGEAGSAVFWQRIKENPEELMRYIALLSETKRKNDWTDYEKLAELNAKWRREHPKEAYKKAYHAIRCAMRAQGYQRRKTKEPLPLKMRLLKKYRHEQYVSLAHQRGARKQWAQRSEEERGAVGAKIGAKSKAAWSKISSQEERSKRTETARAAIDREKQGKAASAGMKKFWEDLRADPERYKDYIDRRKKSAAESRRKKSEGV